MQYIAIKGEKISHVSAFLDLDVFHNHVRQIEFNQNLKLFLKKMKNIICQILCTK
jgi:hypothetical protein